MKVSTLLSAAALPILSAACASLPGAPIAHPPVIQEAAHLPPPVSCLTAPQEPTANPSPTLPELASPPPRPQQPTLAWWRAAATYFESRARRSELAQAFAANVADSERDARIANAITQNACAQELRERDQPAASAAPSPAR